MTTTPLQVNTARAAVERPYLEQLFNVTDEQAFQCFKLSLARLPQAAQKLLASLRETEEFKGLSEEAVWRKAWNALPANKKTDYYTNALLLKGQFNVTASVK